MKLKTVLAYKNKGFTLVEMAIVLVIIGLLIAAFLIPLTAQLEQTRNAEAHRDLLEIKEALLGFAVTNFRLPCPDTTGDGVDDGCADTNSTSSTGGNLPWVTLGVKSTDPWNRPYQYRVNNAFSGVFVLITTGTGAGILRVCTDNTCTTLPAPLEANNVPAVIYSSGNNGAIQPPVGIDELENTILAGSKFDRTFVDHEFAPVGSASGQFDDIVDWISPNILFNRMIAAGRLP